MKLDVADDYDDLSRRAAALVVDQMRAKPSSLCVFPTGNTPRGMFRVLIERVRSEGIDTSSARFVVLDEYARIAEGDRRSLTDWLRRELLNPLGVGNDRVLHFDPSADPIGECTRMDRAISRAGGLDLAILGLGPNGHLGMNEPGTPFDRPCAYVELTPETIRSNAVYWGSEADVPRTGFTLGLGTLSGATSFVLLVSGAHKADILACVLSSHQTTELPATIVHRHPSALIIADRAALSGLESRP
jgi:glucosamine-6-phosphate deaminase